MGKITPQEELKKSWGRQVKANHLKKEFYENREKAQAEKYRALPKNPYARNER